MMDLNTIWSAGLTLATGLITFFLKEKFAELKRLEILLNRTREEIAREYVTNSEIVRITDHIDQRFNRLEAKIDQLIQGK
jgi:hypothetical protein